MSTRPTLERTLKPDYELIKRNRRRANTLEALRSKVSDDVISDAHYWIRCWELGMNGYCDAMKSPLSPPVPGNLFTFNAQRAKALRPVYDFKRFAGDRQHLLLVQLLACSWSFLSIGQANWPNLNINTSRIKASDECAATLVNLHDFWTQERKKAARLQVEAARLYNSGTTLPNLCKRYNMAAPGLRKMIADGNKILHRPRHGLTAVIT